MADIYDRATALAVRQLAIRPAGKGAALTIQRKTQGAFDPVTRTRPEVLASYNTSGVRLQYKLADIDGQTVIAGDVQLLVSPQLTNGAATPQAVPGDIVQFAGAAWTVIANRPVDFVGAGILQKLQVRK